MSKMKKEKSVTVGIGIPTILVLFIILAMVILSLLTYLKEENNSKIVEREITYTQNYYLADAKAKYLLDSEDEAYGEEVSEHFTKNNGILSFIINVDEKRVLNVKKVNNTVVEYNLKTKEN